MSDIKALLLEAARRLNLAAGRESDYDLATKLRAAAMSLGPALGEQLKAAYLEGWYDGAAATNSYAIQDWNRSVTAISIGAAIDAARGAK